MAFNPFHKFRKHQKALFAVLTIFCMFSFVMCSGVSTGGDMASWLTRQFGGGSKYPKVASLYGKDVDQKQISDLEQQRILAHEFLMRAIDAAAKPIYEEEVKRAENLKKQEGHATANPRMFEPRAVETLPETQEIIASYNRLFPRQRGLKDVLDFMIWQHQADALGIHLTKDDVQKLLYRMTNKRVAPGSEEVRKRLTPAAANKILNDIAREGPRFMGRDQGLTARNISMDLLFKALAEEFRVEIARMALEGHPAAPRNILALPELDEVPSLPTPEQYWDYYRKQCSTVEVALVPFKAESFLSQVKDKPTDDDIAKLYDKGKDREPEPLSSEPGFKRPRQLQAQWVSGKADSAYYRDTSARNAKVAEAVRLFGTAGLSEMGAAATTVIDLNVAELNLMSGYYDSTFRGKYIYDRRDLAGNFVWDDLNKTQLPAELMKQPLPASALVGQVLSAVGSGMPAPVAIVSAEAAAFGGPKLRETDERLARMILRASGPEIPALATAAVIYYSGVKEDHFPYALARPQLVKEETEKQARDLLIDNLRQLQNVVEMKATGAGFAELAALAAPSPLREKATQLASQSAAQAVGLAAPNPLAALAIMPAASKDSPTERTLTELRDQVVAKLIKEHEFKTGSTTALRGQKQNKIADDAGLKPLKDAYLKPPAEDSAGERFGDLFFSKSAPFVVDFWPRDTGGFGPDRVTWRTADEPFIYWLTEDYLPQVVPLEPTLKRDATETAAATIGGALTGPFGAVAPYRLGAEPVVRQQVEAFWRLQKARELAKKEAERVAKEEITKIAEAVNKTSATPAVKKKELEEKLRDLAEKYKSSVIPLEPLAKEKYEPSPQSEGEFRHVLPKIDKKMVPNLAPEMNGSFFASGQVPPQMINQYVDLFYKEATAQQKKMLARGMTLAYGDAFAEELLKLQDKPRGDTVVAADSPLDTYYVAVLLNQELPSVQTFAKVYRHQELPLQIPGMPTPPQRPFFESFVAEQQIKYRIDLMERLRKDAKLDIVEKAGRLNPDEGE